MSNHFSHIFSKVFPISDYLYLLQLEEYNSIRYFRLLKRFFWRRSIQQRDSLVLTTRIKITAIIMMPFSIVLPIFIPLWIGIANIILSPFFSLSKWHIQKKASHYFAKTNTRTKVIAIAGSYGKTTTKYYLYEILHFFYRTQMIPQNINTSMGIAAWVLSSFNPRSEILLVEVDTYQLGEIRSSLSITPPDISILTNVGDQHLERFNNKCELKKALEEVVFCVKKGGVVFRDLKTAKAYARAVSRHLQIPNDIIDTTLETINPPERRGSIRLWNGFECLDHSYNISLETSQESIRNARKWADSKGKKLLIVTAGIPELGKENSQGNIELSKLLQKNGDSIILLQSIFSHDIRATIDSKKLFYAHSMKEAEQLLHNYVPEKWVILLLPELTDVYY